MKKIAMRAISLIMGAIIMAFTLVSCSKEPYDYELKDYITVPEDLSTVTVTHDEVLAAVNQQIESVLKNKATYETVTQRGAMPGDIVKLSFSCYKTDDKKTALPEISDSDCTLILGENKYPAELENQLIRRVPDESFSVTVTLPEKFTASDLAGKKIIYEVQIKQIQAAVIPEYNDEFVKSISSFQTTLEYEQYLYERMKEEIIFDKLLNASNVKLYPVDEVQSYTSSFTKYYTEKADELKITLEQYAAKKFFINMTDFHLKSDAYAKELVKEEMLLYTLARRYDIELTDEEYTEGAQKYVAEYGLSSVSKLEAKFGTVYVQQTVLMDKVLAYLSERIEVSGAPTT